MIVNFGYRIQISQITKQTKNKLIYGGWFLFILILLAFAENKVESYVLYLFPENNFIGLILIIPLALYTYIQSGWKKIKIIHQPPKKILKMKKDTVKKCGHWENVMNARLNH